MELRTLLGHNTTSQRASRRKLIAELTRLSGELDTKLYVGRESPAQMLVLRFDEPTTTSAASEPVQTPSLAFRGVADMTSDEPRVRATVLQFLAWLVAGDYAAIERFTAGVRLSSEQMREAISEYGRTLAMPPASALDQLDVIEITGSVPRTWSVRVDLWTAEEGRSDLSMECTLIDCPGELLATEVDNLHVL